MAERSASVALVLNKRGFVAGTREAEAVFAGSLTRMAYRAGALTRSVQLGAKSIVTFAKSIPQALNPRNAFEGIISGFKNLETRGVAAAKRIRDAWRAGLAGLVLPDSAKVVGRRGSGLFGRAAAAAGSRVGSGSALGMTGAFLARDLIAGTARKGIDIAERANTVEEKAAAISVQARGAGGKYVSPRLLEAEAYATAAQVKGTTAEGALDALSKFVTLTGDLDTARKSLSTFATVAKATGSDMGAIAETTASISQQFQITDPTQIQEVLAALVYQGKAGAVELSDLASGFQRLAAAGAAFGVSKDVAGVRKLGGFAQLGRQGTGNAEQLFTAIENTFKAFQEKSGDFKKAGVNIYEGKGAAKHTRSFDEILIDAVSKVGGKNVEKKNEELNKLFGTEAMRAINPLVAKYQGAFQGATGKGGGAATDAERQAAGIAALREAFATATDAAGTYADVQEDAAQVSQTNSAKWTAASEALQGKVADAVLPRLTELVDKLANSGNALDLFVEALKLMADFAEGVATVLKKLGFFKTGGEVAATPLLQARGARSAADKAAEALRAAQMSPEAIKALEKSDPEELARRRKRAGELQIKADVEGASASRWEDLAERSPFAFQQGVGLRTPQQQAAESAAESVTAGAAGGAPRGPITIEGNRTPITVRVVADDTQRGQRGAVPPMPASYPRP